MARILLVAATVIAALALTFTSILLPKDVDNSNSHAFDFKLSHMSLSVRASSLAASAGHEADNLQYLSAVAAIVTTSSREEELALSEHLFHKTMFALHGSHAATSSTPLSTRSLGAKLGDRQHFLHFTTLSDVRALVALQKFSGLRVAAHVQGGLYVAVGHELAAAKARRFPGVSWVQEREALSKIGSQLQRLLKETAASLKERHDHSARSAVDGAAEIVAECWYDGCQAAAVAVNSVCPDVYVHPTILEVHCPASSVHAAVIVLSEHIGVDFVNIKTAAFVTNFAGRAIIGSGPDAVTPNASRVLSEINVSGSIIGIADSGVDMNSCFFYDNASSIPWNNSRVVQSYVVQPCEMCGRCCGFRQGANCTNSLNACGNYVDEVFHGTHVAGTVAGSGPGNVAYGNGIAQGASLFFQDIQNILSNDQCYAPNLCGGEQIQPPTDLFNLFKPAYDAGVRVHSNSWGSQKGLYDMNARAIDAFSSSNPMFLVLIAAGNDGDSDVVSTVTSASTCKNCLTIGATQHSEDLFRSMSPYVDNGFFCSIVPGDQCCTNPLGCVDRCCSVMSLLNASLPCCAKQTTCSNSGECSVESGNLRSSRNMAYFSSRGPTFDGRFKPDLVGPGQDVLSAATPKQITPGAFKATSPNHCVVPSGSLARSAQDDFDKALALLSGTSMSTPLLAGAAEKIRQYFMQGYYPKGIRHSGISFEPEAALLRAVFIASCVGVFSDQQSRGVWTQAYPFLPGFFRFLVPSEVTPDFFQGFGLPVLDHAVYMDGSSNGHRMLFTNGSYSPSSLATAYNISCDAASAIRLTLVLVWTDPPGSIYGDKQLVNDLDLIVIVPASPPSQLFGNMRSFADQTNTVERVITRCPAAGFVTAIIAPGNSLKTSSQAWHVVANGAVSSIDRLSALPAYSRGRATGPATQSQSCVLDNPITVSVKFKPSRAWACAGSIGAWNCSVNMRLVVTLLAQTLNAAVQGFGRTSSDSNGMTIVLRCSSIVDTWGYNSSEDAVSFRYVTAVTLQNSIWTTCNTAASACDADPILGVFDWSTFLMAPYVPVAAARVTMSITAYDDASCLNRSSSYLTAANPLLITDQGCFPGPVLRGRLLYMKALSCNSTATLRLSMNSDRSCAPEGDVSQVVGACGQIAEISSVATTDVWTVVTCSSTSPSGSCQHGSLCLLIPDAAFYAIIAVLVAHLLQALAWVVVSKKKFLFSAANFMIVLLLPVAGLVKWLPLCRSSASSKLHEETLLEDMTSN